MRLKSEVKNQNGFTLVEMVIAGGIIATLALASATISVNAKRANDYAAHKANFQALGQQISENLRTPEACAKALGPLSASAQTVNETALQQLSTVAGGGWQAELTLTGINSGPAMTGSMLSATAPNNLIAPRRLRIDSLRFAGGQPLPPSGVDRRYLTNLYLAASEINGMSFKETLIGTTTITVDDATSKVSGCQSVSSQSFQAACVDMGCSFNGALTPACRCLRTQVVCAAPGAFPVAFTSDGYPTCVQAGGDNMCPAGEYLAGFGIGYKECVKIPTTSLIVAAPTPLGSCTLQPEVITSDLHVACVATTTTLYSSGTQDCNVAWVTGQTLNNATDLNGKGKCVSTQCGPPAYSVNWGTRQCL